MESILDMVTVCSNFDIVRMYSCFIRRHGRGNEKEKIRTSSRGSSAVRSKWESDALVAILDWNSWPSIYEMV